jgi:hypothetical protein
MEGDKPPNPPQGNGGGANNNTNEDDAQDRNQLTVHEVSSTAMQYEMVLFLSEEQARDLEDLVREERDGAARAKEAAEEETRALLGPIHYHLSQCHLNRLSRGVDGWLGQRLRRTRHFRLDTATEAVMDSTRHLAWTVSSVCLPPCPLRWWDDQLACSVTLEMGYMPGTYDHHMEYLAKSGQMVMHCYLTVKCQDVFEAPPARYAGRCVVCQMSPEAAEEAIRGVARGLIDAVHEDQRRDLVDDENGLDSDGLRPAKKRASLALRDRKWAISMCEGPPQAKPTGKYMAAHMAVRSAAVIPSLQHLAYLRLEEEQTLMDEASEVLVLDLADRYLATVDGRKVWRDALAKQHLQRCSQSCGRCFRRHNTELL